MAHDGAPAQGVWATRRARWRAGSRRHLARGEEDVGNRRRRWIRGSHRSPVACQRRINHRDSNHWKSQTTSTAVSSLGSAASIALAGRRQLKAPDSLVQGYEVELRDTEPVHPDLPRPQPPPARRRRHHISLFYHRLGNDFVDFAANLQFSSQPKYKRKF
ncbi:unnamed protein product [Urochloa humidicola]